MIIHIIFTFVLCIMTLVNAATLTTALKSQQENLPLKITSKTQKSDDTTNTAKKVNAKMHNPFKVINGITRKDLGYYKMLSWHYPDIFTLKVNDKIIEEGKSIECSDSILLVRYDYEWTTPWGKQIGAKEVTFEIPAEVTELNITFVGWQQEERINISNAKKISEEKLVT